jgi:hypothetical protein
MAQALSVPLAVPSSSQSVARRSPERTADKAGTLVARVRRRLFPPTVQDANTPAAAPSRRGINLQASLAELLLINRLKARSTQREQAAEMLERASHVVFVTCKHWFAEPEVSTVRQPHRTQL